MDEIGKRIKHFRQLRGLKQTELAERVNKSKSYMSQVESNKEKPNIELLASIAEVLKINVSDLFEKKFEIGEEDDKWIAFGKEVEKEGYSIEQLKQILELAKKINIDK
ncbi:hypothetical protein HMPREF3291_05080 [Bacillus sp. HMSC76G11]|nr:hypothetical protein HMPREF3291_05080 [Bacillus sp. HMSC76G11]